jgi:hypothetical protein
MSLPEINDRRESNSESNIHRAPDQSFSKSRTAAPPVQDPQVEYQHAQCEDVEEHPIEQEEILAALRIVYC